MKQTTRLIIPCLPTFNYTRLLLFKFNKAAEAQGVYKHTEEPQTNKPDKLHRKCLHFKMLNEEKRQIEVKWGERKQKIQKLIVRTEQNLLHSSNFSRLCPTLLCRFEDERECARAYTTLAIVLFCNFSFNRIVYIIAKGFDGAESQICFILFIVRHYKHRNVNWISFSALYLIDWCHSMQAFSPPPPLCPSSFCIYTRYNTFKGIFRYFRYVTQIKPILSNAGKMTNEKSDKIIRMNWCVSIKERTKARREEMKNNKKPLHGLRKNDNSYFFGKYFYLDSDYIESKRYNANTHTRTENTYPLIAKVFFVNQNDFLQTQHVPINRLKNREIKPPVVFNYK